jgi:thymidylate synthase ThyX
MAMSNLQSAPQFSYYRESFTDRERSLLQPYFTNLDGPVFALTNLPEVIKGALFARYSRSPLSLRRLFLEEFVSNSEIATQLVVLNPGENSIADTQRAETLYRRIFTEYGDDSVAQLGGVHLACEQSSNLLTKVLEWGRLAAYLEQSTRYIRYDRPLGDRWRYYVPPEIESSQAIAEFHRVMDRLFSTYSRLASDLTSFFEKVYPQGMDSIGVWRSTLRAKACDIARGLLPVATMSNVGIFADGQAFESMILRMKSLPLREANDYADLMLTELRRVIPAFMARIDVADKGQATTRYMKDTREALDTLVAQMELPEIQSKSEFSVELIDWDRDGEQRIVADALYASSTCSAAELRRLAERMSATERESVLTAYVGERGNRRHKPGRAFEAANYHFEIVCDYANFRDLQRHRMLTIDWQRITPDHGFSTPEMLTAVGAQEAWVEAIEAASGLYRGLSATHGRDVAQYVLPFASKLRFYLRMNAREAMHFIELRTGKQGHTQYRQVSQRMIELIRDRAGHRAVAAAMSFADMVPDYELSRLEGERRAEQKRSAAS